ncbi:unnamed protein product, partial [Polarella glacialis]
LAVFEKRGSWIRSDTLLGETVLQLGETGSLPLGQPLEECLELRRGEQPFGKLVVRFTFLKLQDAKATITKSTKHSLLMVVKALVQLLHVPGGVKLLLSARPPGVRLIREDQVYSELRKLQDRLSSEPWEDSQEEIWFGRLSKISRQLLDFVAQHTDPDADLPQLIVEWMLHVSAKVGVAHRRGSAVGLMNAQTEERLRRFLAAAQLRLEDLVPVDARNNVLSSWRQKAASLREAGNWHFALDQIPEESVLGSGSFGTVWRARDCHTGQLYAVKNVLVPRRGMSKVGERESDVAERICAQPHKCVVRLFHVCHFPDLRLYCFVMEICGKGNLKNWIWDMRKRLHAEKQVYNPPPQAYHWVGQVLLGMEHLHTKLNMLVRDLKADNVVLNGKGHAKLTDFGLCRFGKEATGDWTFGVPPGTPAYIAPEVIRGENYGDAADFYSLGVLIWVILTGGLTGLREPSAASDDNNNNTNNNNNQSNSDNNNRIIESLEPVPPCAKMAHNWDYSALAENHKLMASCVTDPEPNLATALPSQDARDLVLALTSEEPHARPGFEQLRSCALLRALRLPAASASLDELEAWLAEAPPANRQLPSLCLSCGGLGCGLCRPETPAA